MSRPYGRHHRSRRSRSGRIDRRELRRRAVSLRLINRSAHDRHGQARRTSSLTRYATLVGIFLLAMIGGSLLFTGAVTVAAWNYFSADLPSLNAVEAQQFETTQILDRNGKLLYEVSDPLTGYRNYTTLDQITAEGENNFLVEATIAAEDRTFWNNFGVDYSLIL